MEQDLTRIATAADHYIDDHLHKFDPLDWEDPDESELSRKSFSELSLYLYVVEQHGGRNPDVRAHVQDLVNDPRFPKLLRRNPGRFGQLVLPVILMRSLGDLEPNVVEAAEAALRNPNLWGKERRPYQLVVLLAQCALWGYDEHGHRLDSVVETSNAAHPPNPITTGEYDFYGLAHNVMFATMLGTDHPDLLDAPLPYDLELAVTGGLLRFLADKNADVVLELLVTGALQRQLPDRLLQYAVRWLAEEKTTDTHVVPPVVSKSGDLAVSREDVLKSLSRDAGGTDEIETEAWGKSYHTNVTAGIAVTVLRDTLDVSAYDTDDVSLSSAEFGEILALGEALNQLNDYDLGGAAETLSDVDPQTFEQFPDISRCIVSFLERQRSGDVFGYWVDERRLYEQQAGDGTDFETELVEPLSEQCREVVADISSRLPDAD